MQNYLSLIGVKTNTTRYQQ